MFMLVLVVLASGIGLFEERFVFALSFFRFMLVVVDVIVVLLFV